MKSIEDYFRDWEGETFGMGYGTGEPHTLAALKGFMSLIGQSRETPRSYDYRVLESGLGPQVAWLMLNILANNDQIEYGTSPRFGWLTKSGVALKEFVDSRTTDQLVEICCNEPDGYIHCYSDHCNCDGEKCQNPFWVLD
ncbi:hypothetical protein [Pseudorhodoplanes sp.]|uniref:hypothetical protein n=1 Tax=Pseudorhodoplanes sp. TaxID=1934341 RepID=UPI002C1C3767|nr:hypothetical protein [Pseudorhodoplanes sp.]HWV44151.1 hypothetical protein [Pseudorhodoplanes sp.]